MPNYNLKYEPKVYKFLEKFKGSKKDFNLIKSKLKDLENGILYNDKRIKNSNRYRKRAGDYRIFYNLDEEIITITIIEISSRERKYL